MSHTRHKFRPIIVSKPNPPITMHGPLQSPARAIAEELAAILRPRSEPAQEAFPVTPPASQKKWVQATHAIEAIIASGERYTSERDIAGRIGMSLKSTQTAFKRSENLQQWKAASEPAPPPVESLSVVHLDRRAAPEQVPEVDEEEVRIALSEILRAAEPTERGRVEGLSAAEKRNLASLYLSREWGADRDRRPDHLVYRTP